MKKIYTLTLFIISCVTLIAQEYKTYYTSLEEALKTPDQVYKLDLTSQSLIVIPESISQLTNLTDLDLSYNDIKSLPSRIFSTLGNINSLNIEGNKIAHLPGSVYELEKLEYLNLNGNPIDSLSDNIIQLKKLKFLYCSFYSSDEEGYAFEFGEPVEYKKIPFYLPNSLFELSNISTVDLHGRWIKINFPLTKVTALSKLDFSNCFIEKIPDSWSHDREWVVFGDEDDPYLMEEHVLLDLNLSNNPLSKESVNTLFKMSYLSDVDVSGCHLSVLPEEYKFSEQINGIKLNNNNINNIPGFLINRPLNTSWIEISNNKIVSIKDSELNVLSKLRHLDITNNPLNEQTIKRIKEFQNNNNIEAIKF